MSENRKSKEPLLFLCHRIPFPPNKGDKIRSFNILKKLNEEFDVYLGCFIDDTFDERYVDELKSYCHTLFHLKQNKVWAKIKGLKSFATNQAITLPYYADKLMHDWVKRTVSENKISKVFVYSSSMAQYVEDKQYAHLHRVIDFVDVDSDKWRQYAEKKSGLSRWVFNREFKQLARYEDKICQLFEHSLFVSPDEAKLFSERQPTSAQEKVHGMLNGVDINFFDPNAEHSHEDLVPNTPFLSFTGAMDYWANVDSVVWFADHVWPIILASKPEVKFVIAGGNPTPDVQALQKRQGIVVTGRVNDVRPFIAKAHCVVAPMRIARGIQNKVLEAMSLNKSVVCTTMAMEGINAEPSKSVFITDDAQEFATYCLELLERPIHQENDNREWIKYNFTWQQTLVPLANYLKESH